MPVYIMDYWTRLTGHFAQQYTGHPSKHITINFITSYFGQHFVIPCSKRTCPALQHRLRDQLFHTACCYFIEQRTQPKSYFKTKGPHSTKYLFHRIMSKLPFNAEEKFLTAVRSNCLMCENCQLLNGISCFASNGAHY